MATTGTKKTLADWAKELDPDGKTAAIAEVLAEQNDIIDDVPWQEGNLPTGHRSSIRADLPSGTWRKLNYGVQPTKAQSVQVDDSCGMLEAYSEVDKDLADLNGNASDFRLNESKAHLEGLAQDFADTLFYADTDLYPERFLGFMPRYPSLGTSNVINGGGSGSDLSSILIVGWGDDTVFGIFPRGSRAGLRFRDLGEVTLQDAAGGLYQGYRGHFQWKCGLVVKDWRYVVRIANIESAVSMSGTTANGFAAFNPLIYALNLIPNQGKSRICIYVNKFVKSQADIVASQKNNLALSIQNVEGKPVTTFWGFPVKRCDALLSTETALT